MLEDGPKNTIFVGSRHCDQIIDNVVGYSSMAVTCLPPYRSAVASIVMWVSCDSAAASTFFQKLRRTVLRPSVLRRSVHRRTALRRSVLYPPLSSAKTSQVIHIIVPKHSESSCRSLSIVFIFNTVRKLMISAKMSDIRSKVRLTGKY